MSLNVSPPDDPAGPDYLQAPLTSSATPAPATWRCSRSHLTASVSLPGRGTPVWPFTFHVKPSACGARGDPTTAARTQSSSRLRRRQAPADRLRGRRSSSGLQTGLRAPQRLQNEPPRGDAFGQDRPDPAHDPWGREPKAIKHQSLVGRLHSHPGDLGVTHPRRRPEPPAPGAGERRPSSHGPWASAIPPPGGRDHPLGGTPSNRRRTPLARAPERPPGTGPISMKTSPCGLSPGNRFT